LVYIVISLLHEDFTVIRYEVMSGSPIDVKKQGGFSTNVIIPAVVGNEVFLSHDGSQYEFPELRDHGVVFAERPFQSRLIFTEDSDISGDVAIFCSHPVRVKVITYESKNLVWKLVHLLF